MNLDNVNSSYIITSSNNIESLRSFLFGKGYSIIDITGYYNGEFEESVIAWSPINNEELKKDAKKILEIFNQDSLILKTVGNKNPTKLFRTGKERELGVIMYNTDNSNKSYLYNGISFSFQEKKSYKFLKEEFEFKKGMVVECESRDGWVEKEIKEPSIEYKNVYSILVKYNKVRILAD